nr:hypothetical protein BaRGS_008922 [Batillaria attramentaria]
MFGQLQDLPIVNKYPKNHVRAFYTLAYNCGQLRDLLAKKQRENHAYFNTSYNFVCNSDFSRLCNKRDIIIAGDIKPGSNTGQLRDLLAKKQRENHA